MTRRRWLLISGTVLAVAWLASVEAQTPAPRAGEDLVPALVLEVRGLRAAIERMAAGGPRVQLALGRLQMQEQRLNAAIARLDSTRTQLRNLQQAHEDVQQQIKSLESVERDSSSPPPTPRSVHGDQLTPQQMVEIRRHHHQQLTRLSADLQRVTAEEAAYASDVATEQARWTELNRRLEELEHALQAP